MGVELNLAPGWRVRTGLHAAQWHCQLERPIDKTMLECSQADPQLSWSGTFFLDHNMWKVQNGDQARHGEGWLAFKNAILQDLGEDNLNNFKQALERW